MTTEPSADTMERARAALSAALRDPRCGVAVRMTMIHATHNAFSDAIAQALTDAQEEARREAAAEIERLRAERDKVYEALSDLCDKHHCLPGVNQIEFLDNRLSRLTSAQLRIRELEDGLRLALEWLPCVEGHLRCRPPFKRDDERIRALVERNSK